MLPIKQLLACSPAFPASATRAQDPTCLASRSPTAARQMEEPGRALQQEGQGSKGSVCSRLFAAAEEAGGELAPSAGAPPARGARTRPAGKRLGHGRELLLLLWAWARSLPSTSVFVPCNLP